MQRKVLLLVIAGVVLASGIYVKHYFSPKQVIKRRLFRAKDAFEEGRFLGAIKPIDKGYRDTYGLDWESLAGHVKAVMDNYEDLRMDLDVISFNLSGHEARMAVRFELTAREGSQRTYVMGGPDEACRAILVWQKKRQGFLIVTTTDLDVPGFQDEIRRRQNGAR